MGYQELTAERADLIEVLNLDEQGKTIRELVEDPLLAAGRGRIKEAGDALGDNDLPRLALWEDKCSKCDLAELCRDEGTTMGSRDYSSAVVTPARTPLGGSVDLLVNRDGTYTVWRLGKPITSLAGTSRPT